MFKKLKERVEGAESPEKDGPYTPTTRRSSMPVANKGRQKVGGLYKTDSVSSLSSISEADILSGRMSSDDLISALMQRTTKVKKLEMKLADYTQALKVCSKEKEKLTLVLEKQQDSAMKRMSELEESSSLGRKKMEQFILKFEKKEADLIETVKTLKEENQKLHESVDKWENESDDFERKKRIAKLDNKEELSNLQMQEMAKLKHVLVLSEKECENKRHELDQKVDELLQCQGTNEELESSLRAVIDSLNSNRRELEMQINDNDNLASKNSALTKDNKHLKEKITTLISDIKQTQSKLHMLEAAHSDNSEKYESLKHSSEAIINKATVELDEKQIMIDHLKEKVALLEKRATTETLSENEQVQALISERTTLENKLEESRLQLSNIKSTWSIKISQLEQQVSHMNAKIAENHEELAVKDQKILQLGTVSKEMRCLQAEFDDTKAEYKLVLQQKENYSRQVTKLEADMIEQSTKHGLELSKLILSREEFDASVQEKERRLKGEISRLETLQLEVQEKTTLMHNEMESVKLDNEEKAKALDHVQQSRSALQEQCEHLKESNQKLVEKLKSIEERLSCSAKDSLDLKDQLVATQSKAKEYSDGYDKAKSEIKSGNCQLETVRQWLAGKEKELYVCKEAIAKNDSITEKLKEEIKSMELLLQSMEDKLMKSKEETASLRNRNAEDDNKVSGLKEEMKKLEDLLAERERTIKVQQQRLNDLKKALSKELSKKSSSALNRSDDHTPSIRRGLAVNGLGSSGHLNATAEDSGPEDAVVSVMPINDEDLTTVNAKYLKHVMLTFLSGSRSEAQQLVKALSVLLNFNKDEEKFVKEILEYRGSWFGSKPSAKTHLPNSKKR